MNPGESGFDSSSPPVDFWGLLIAGKSSRSAISRPRPLHRRRSVGGLLQRFATWRNLFAVSLSGRAYKKSPGRVSDRARWAGTSLCPHGMFFDGASKCGHRDVPAHRRRGPLTWVWADDCFHTLTYWKQRRTRCVPTSSSGGCSVSHLRCPESAGNFRPLGAGTGGSERHDPVRLGSHPLPSSGLSSDRQQVGSRSDVADCFRDSVRRHGSGCARSCSFACPKAWGSRATGSHQERAGGTSIDAHDRNRVPSEVTLAYARRDSP